MIFIWIPKTGGTTFSVENRMKVVTERYNEQRDLGYFKALSFGHANPKDLLRERIISHEMWTQSRVVTIVRNPYDRFLSLYYDYKRTGRIMPEMSQLDFIRAIREMDPKPGLFNSYNLSMCAPQVEWILPGIEILRFEDLISEWKLHENRSGIHKMLDDFAIDDINKFYMADFATLKYGMIRV